MVTERAEVKEEDRWNVEALFPSFEAWEEELKRWQGKQEQLPRFPDLVAYKGTLGTSPAKLAEFIQKYLLVDRALAKLYTYAHLRHDEDVGNDQHKQAYARVVNLLSDFRQELSWVEPEILLIPEEVFKTFLQSDLLKDYRIFLEKIVRQKPHTLSAEKEELLALASLPMETAHKAFSAFNNGDLKFPNVKDSEGKEHELTHGRYQLYMKGRDRTLRESAFKTLNNSYAAYENTLCELIQGEIQRHVFEKKARHFNSCLEAALFPHQIETSVYTSLIQAVRENLHVMHKYFALRKKLLGYGELRLWDLSVPLVKEFDFKMDFPTAVKEIVASVAVLGSQYQKDLEKGLTQDRWVDRYENARKRSGAYSSGCFDSMPYILMNYQGTFSDVMTLIHEAGHSMHTLMSSRHQPYQYSHYPIFVAEVASTFNEELLSRHLQAKAKTKEEKAFLINQKIDDIRATFFRQAMFAEFELRLHEWVEKGVPLTPGLLKTEYRKLNAEYFGSEVTLDNEIEIEWARIPHFYYNFYVYQYATGISAAMALVERLFKEGDKAREDYLKFLSSGSSKYPLDLLAIAGADMRKPDAVKAILSQFEKLVSELEKLLSDNS